MKFTEKSLTVSTCGEQVKNAIPCTFRNHAAALKGAATVKYVDKSGLDKTFYALFVSTDKLFTTADQYDDEVITACLLAAGYRSVRDLTKFEDAVKTATSAAAPLEKRYEDLSSQAAACGDEDAEKHDKIMKELDAIGPDLADKRDALAKARAALNEELTADIELFMGGFGKRGEMLTAISEWLYNNASDRFAAIADAADEAVRARASEFAGRMLAYVDEIVDDDEFPVNQKGRRCSCGDVIEDKIVKAIKRPFNGGVGYKHTATGGTRYCDVPRKVGTEVVIEKITD